MGEHAKGAAKLEPAHVVFTPKRVMGDPNASFHRRGKDYSPQQVSAFILGQLARDAAEATGLEVKDVVITCPAYFGTNERAATQQAGEIAGLNVRYIIPEPTAAAFAYGVEQETDQNVLVYDLGGGTFDVTVIEVRSNQVRVVCTGGDRDLGGVDWDGAVVQWLAETHGKEHNLDPEQLLEDKEVLASLRLLAEDLKRALTHRNSVKHRLDFVGKSTTIELTREMFEDLTKGLLERTVMLTQQVIERARELGLNRIDLVLMVGGSSYMPQVRRRLEAELSIPLRLLDPNQIVAKGAALFGQKLMFDAAVEAEIRKMWGGNVPKDQPIVIADVPEAQKNKAIEQVAAAQGVSRMRLAGLVEKSVINTVSRSFGVKVVVDDHGTEAVNNMVIKDDPVPRRVVRTFLTFSDGQRNAKLVVMENVHTNPDPDHHVLVQECNLLGDAVLAFARPLPRGSEIEISFALAEDGRLAVHGRDLTTGGVVEAIFETQGAMNAVEMAEARTEHIRLLRPSP